MGLDFFRRHYRAYQWAKALRLSSRGKIEEALRVALSLDGTIKKQPHWHLFQVHQFGLLKKHSDTLIEAREFISYFHSKKELTPNERYFLAFAQWYGLVAFKKLYPSKPIPEELKFDLNSFQMVDVSPYWKGVFPMPIHPEWQEDSLS